MTRLQPEDYLDHLRRESGRFLAVLGACDPAAPVPACPAWDAGDLLHHLTGVQWFWSRIVLGATDPGSVQEPDRPASYAEQLALFDDCSTALIGALAAADPAAPAWSWASEQTVGFTFRRQAHEALIHRLDAEQAAGVLTPLDPALAADGVAELVDVMYGGPPPSWGLVTPGPHVVRIDLTDTGDQLWTRPGRFTGTDPDTGTAYDEPTLDRLAADPGTPADAVVSGVAADVDAWMWNRSNESGLELTGDPDALAPVRAAISASLD